MCKYEWIINAVILMVWGMAGMRSLDLLFETGEPFWGFLLVISVLFGCGHLVSLLYKATKEVPF